MANANLNYEVVKMIQEYLERNEIHPLHIGYIMEGINSLVYEVRCKERLDTIAEIQNKVMNNLITDELLNSNENTKYLL